MHTHTHIHTHTLTLSLSLSHMSILTLYGLGEDDELMPGSLADSVQEQSSFVEVIWAWDVL